MLVMRLEYHKNMQVSSQADPRANQKERTRAALVAAAAELLRAGTAPTVLEAAEAAKVSRATAYRYFPTQEALLVEVAQLNPTVAPVEALLAELPRDDPPRALRELVGMLNRLAIKDEAHMRSALRVYLDTWLDCRRQGIAPPAVREGRRMRWLDEVLEPVRLRLGRKAWRRLSAALALTLGPDAIVVMKDVCRLDDEEALDVLEWAAGVLLQAGLEAPDRPTKRPRRAGTR
jgi:AcrR family transcriptional regulator